MAELRTLVALGASRSISAAAEVVNVSQPALSQHLRELEEKLGTRLFERGRSGLRPTDTGKVLIRCAKATKASLDVAAHDLVAISKAESPRLRIGFQTTTTFSLLGPSIVRFAEQTPECTALIYEETRDALVEMLRTGHLDVFIGRIPEDATSKGLETQILSNEAAVIVSSRDHPLARKRGLGLQRLMPEPWVLPGPGTAFHSQVEETFHLNGYALPHPVVEARSFMATAAIVASSKFLGFLPASVCGAFTSAGVTTLDVDLSWRLEPVGVLFRKGEDNSPYLPHFVRSVQAVVLNQY
jgi:DNA-binding transcriptional LysR family regulator